MCSLPIPTYNFAGSRGLGGRGNQGDGGGGAGGVQTLVLGGPISMGVYSGGVSAGLETPSASGRPFCRLPYRPT